MFSLSLVSFFISFHLYIFLRTWYDLYTILHMILPCTKIVLQPHAFTSGYCSTHAFTVSSLKPFIIHFFGKFQTRNSHYYTASEKFINTRSPPWEFNQNTNTTFVIFILCITTTRTTRTTSIWTINNNSIVNMNNQQQR